MRELHQTLGNIKPLRRMQRKGLHALIDQFKFLLDGYIGPEALASKSLVYVVAAGGFVKIGESLNVKARLNSMQTDCPHELKLLAVLRGGKLAERKLHGAFRPWHYRGEWFVYNSMAVEAICTIAGLEPYCVETQH